MSQKLEDKGPTPRETEPLDNAVAVRVTASEKRAVQLLALLRDTTESHIMRSNTIEQIVADAESERQSRGTAA